MSHTAPSPVASTSLAEGMNHKVAVVFFDNNHLFPDNVSTNAMDGMVSWKEMERISVFLTFQDETRNRVNIVV